MNSRVKEKNKIKKQIYKLLKKKENILKLIKHDNFLSKKEPYMDIIMIYSIKVLLIYHN